MDNTLDNLKISFSAELSNMFNEKELLSILFWLLSPFEIMSIEEAICTFSLDEFKSCCNYYCKYNMPRWPKFTNWCELFYMIEEDFVTFLVPIIPDVNCSVMFIEKDDDKDKYISRVGVCSGCDERVKLCSCGCNNVNSSRCSCSLIQGVCILTIPYSSLEEDGPTVVMSDIVNTYISACVEDSEGLSNDSIDDILRKVFRE
jgi:hypothetical protein